MAILPLLSYPWMHLFVFSSASGGLVGFVFSVFSSLKSLVVAVFTAVGSALGLVSMEGNELDDDGFGSSQGWLARFLFGDEDYY